MAVTSKFLPFPPSLDPQNQIPRHTQMPKHSTLSPQTKTHFSSLRKTQLSSLTNPSSSSGSLADLSSSIVELCSKMSLDEALKLLESVKVVPVDLDDDAIVALVDLCERKRAYREGSWVYACVSGSRDRWGLRVGKALLSMFVRFRNLSDAWVVFEKMEERDLFSWNVVLGGYAKAGFFEKALSLYCRMLWGGLRPDEYTFPCVLRTCGGVPNLSRGREVHVHVLRYGFGSYVDVVNALITMYVKCGDVVSARLVFDSMLKRDRISWNAMISGYLENGDCVEGVKLFLRMREEGFDPDLMTMTSVVSGCKQLGDERLGRAVHGFVISNGFGVEVSVNNSLIQLYWSSSSWEEAERIFSKMGTRDLVTWTSMISGYEYNGFFEKAVETYRLMEQAGIVPDEIAIASAISACASLGLLDMGMKLHDLAIRTGYISYVIVANILIDLYSKCKCIDKALDVFHQIQEKDVISWTCIITGLSLNNRYFEAIFCFREMKKSLNPHPITLVVALTACNRIGALMCGKEIHAYALKNSLASHSFVSNAILDLYVKCGKIRLARNQFNGGSKDRAAFNIMLAGFAERSQGKSAVQLFQLMIDSGVKPDGVTFVSLLCACSRNGMVRKGLIFFDNMESIYRVSPNLMHYGCIVDLLGRAGKLDDAYAFIQKMPLKPDPAIWGALLNACRIHGCVELGEVAARHIFEVDNQSLGYYILLSNLYSRCDEWEKLADVRRMMKERGLLVDPACSWIEVKGKIHAFLSGVESYPDSKQINLVLKTFYEKMEAVGLDHTTGSSESASKHEILCGHSERLAVAFGLINTSPGVPVSVTKNLYMCQGCHNVIKFISNVVKREICVRDTEQFHVFKDGICSCADEGYQG